MPPKPRSKPCCRLNVEKARIQEKAERQHWKIYRFFLHDQGLAGVVDLEQIRIHGVRAGLFAAAAGAASNTDDGGRGQHVLQIGASTLAKARVAKISLFDGKMSSAGSA